MMKPLYFVPMRKHVWLLLGILIFIWGCPDGKSTTDESVLLSDLQFNYNQGLNELFVSAQVAPSYLGKRLKAVNALYFGFDTTQTADTFLLNDNGSSGDIIADDDVYSQKMNNDTSSVSYVLKPSDTDTVYVKFLAQYVAGNKSIMASYKMGNQGPTILSVSMPDTLKRPGADSVTVSTIVVNIDDPNGHEDVQTCYLMFQKPDGTYSSGSPISLYDDGNKDFSMYLWDDVANDGKFSRYIIIDSNNPLGTYTSHFYARDYSGILSEPFLTKMVVIP
ncbi:MAG: hypothetical protein ACE5D0_07675 [Fidelibacterota bacterium]